MKKKNNKSKKLNNENLEKISAGLSSDQIKIPSRMSTKHDEEASREATRRDYEKIGIRWEIKNNGLDKFYDINTNKEINKIQAMQRLLNYRGWPPTHTC